MRLNMLKRQASGAVLAFVCNLAKAAIVPVALGGLMIPTVSAAQDAVFAFDIPAGPADQSLKVFSDQSGIRVLVDFEAAAHTTTHAVKGRLTGQAALNLLLAGSDLEVAAVNGDRISLRLRSNVSTGISASDTTSATDITEVIVTGTHIRGGNPTSPVHTVTRKDIEQSGYSQIGDVMRSLPENFSGGQNPGVMAASSANVGNQNISNASTVNLRGLGTDATLVLLNGHRLSADSYFQGSDISGVPLLAVQRVEVVPDGASALYGTDAVAGVVNFVLRKNFDGAELAVRYGEASQGGGAEQTYSAMLGKSGLAGYALASLEYSDQGAVTARQRAFTSTVTPDTTLFRPQKRTSLFIAGGKDLSDAFSVSMDALISDRSAESLTQSTLAGTRYVGLVKTPSYNVALNADLKLKGDWKVRTTAVTAASRNSQQTLSGTTVSHGGYHNSVQSLDIVADGTLFATATGAVKTAIGAGYRTQFFDEGTITADRQVTYLYVEALAPLVSPSDSRTGLHELELSLAGRVEDYSDFGTTSNPKVGLRYLPFKDLTVRATWGTSFKAPTFVQLYQAVNLYLYPAAAMGYTGPADRTGMMLYGGNKDLAPERSTSWTLGADYRPAAVRSLILSATYFDIDYTDRVVQPIANLTTGLSNPVYAPFVELNPSAARQAALVADANTFFNFSGGTYDPAKVAGLLLDTWQNASTQTARGLDLSYRQGFPFASGSLDAFANATWLKFQQQTISTVPSQTLSGTIFNAPKFKARVGASWERGGLSATALLNYLSGEIDNGVTPTLPVASWTTIDANLVYRFSKSTGVGRGLRLTFSVTNLLDKNPPYAVSPDRAYPGIYYDSTNASILGRFASLTVAKAW